MTTLITLLLRASRTTSHGQHGQHLKALRTHPRLAQTESMKSGEGFKLRAETWCPSDEKLLQAAIQGTQWCIIKTVRRGEHLLQSDKSIARKYYIHLVLPCHGTINNLNPWYNQQLCYIPTNNRYTMIYNSLCHLLLIK